MRDLFLDDRGLDMTRAGDPIMKGGLGGSPGSARSGGLDGASLGQSGTSGTGLGLGGRPLPGRHVCPFCGSVNESADAPCPRCTMENTADTRKATKSRIGPWYVLQSRNPAAPGMRYETLLGFVRKGRVKARSIVRGPTTHQLWRFACQVKGLSREFGVCYSCAGSIDRAARVCPQCNRPQDPPVDPDTFIEGFTNGAAPASSSAPTQTSTFGTAAVTLGPNITLSSVADSPAEATRPEPAPARPAVFKELTVPALSDEPVAVPAPVAANEAKRAPTAAESPARPTAPIVPEEVPSKREATAAPTPAPAAPDGAPVAKSAGQRKASDVLISARELAAAFQLHFDADADSDEEPTSVRGGAAAVGLGASAGAGDAPLPWPPRRRRKRRFGRLVLVLLLLAVGGFAAYLAVDAGFRQRTFDWASARYASLTGADLYPDLARPAAAPAAAPSARPQSATRPAAGAIATPAASPVDASPRTVAPAAPRPPTDGWPAVDSTISAARAAQPTDEDAPVVDEPQVSTPTSAQTPAPVPGPAASRPSVSPGPSSVPSAADRGGPVAPVAPPPRVPREQGISTPDSDPADVAPQPAPPPATRPVVVAATRPVTAPVPATPRLTPQEAQRRSRLWYSQALDADARGDVAAARDLYKKIMDDLPREVWYSDVEVRYQQARKALGE